MKAQRRYWVSNERGEKDAFDADNLHDVKRIITTKMKHVLQEDGHVSGGYTLERKDSSVVSNGEFRLVNNRAKYYPDYTEKQ